MRPRNLPLALFFAGLALPAAVQAHSVAQVQTAKRISQATVVLLDPQGNPTPGGMGTDTKAKVGDVLTFVIQFTPVPNNASRGAGGYITEYVPANTEVVGARIIDKNGSTIAPKRGPQMDDGWGPRGRHNGFDAMGLAQGSLSQVYADTGIFYSVDPRTARNPADAFITVQNGLPVSPVPTGAGQLDNFLGFAGPPFFAHNDWDLTQAIAFGANGGLVVANGTGNTPFGFGSAVAGPLTHYAFEKVASPKCSNGLDDDGDGAADYPADLGCDSTLDDDETVASDAPFGPWQRIRYAGSETAVGAATDCQSCQNAFVRTGVPTDLGWDLSSDTPLPAGTNAVRFAVGELVVGEEYFAEVSLRVKALPLDPTMMLDVNCSEVFGGDAAMPQQGQDNTWRYFVPAPACVSLNLFFELQVDKLLAVQGDTLTYTINGKNLSVNPQTNVVVTDTFVPADVSFVQATQGPPPVTGAGLLTWPSLNLQPGDAYTFQWQMSVQGNALSTLNRARYVSDQLPAPGFAVVALTDIENIVVLHPSLVASTVPATSPTKISAGGVAHLTGTIQNDGTGPASLNAASFLRVNLPAGFSFCSMAPCAAPKINGANVANPTLTGQAVTFTQGLVAVPAGGSSTLELDVSAAPAVPPGLYTSEFQIQYRDAGVNRDVETTVFGVAPILVDIDRSEPPVLDEPVLYGDTVVTGTSSEGQGATITVFVNGNSVPSVIAGPGGMFSAVVPTTFAGQHLNATAQAPGEVVSVHSTPDVVVQGIAVGTACSDGMDNDGDGLVDFPADPGCTSAGDPDETDVPQCSNGLDDDGNGLVDFPDDPSCSSFADDDEDGVPACSNGLDDDGDGLVDAADPDCADPNDPSEAHVPACANGLDDDGDGSIDYPLDFGCSSASDDDETIAASGGAGGAPTGGAGGVGGAPLGGAGGGQGGPPDPGGVPPDGGVGSGASCGCRAASSQQAGSGALALLASLLLRRRRARARGPGASSASS